MAQQEQGRSEYTVSNKTVEIAVSGAFVAVALLVMYDNWRIGARWVSDGPQAGYFPFYVGLIMFVVSAITLGSNVVHWSRDESNFVERSQLVQVLKVLIPTIVFVAMIFVVGIYFAAFLFIAFFMRWLGRYPFARILPVAVLVPLIIFAMFEIWFLVPLPKGPVETALGF